MDTTQLDRERAAVTARSVLANVDVLEDEGLDATGAAAVIELAERLAIAPSGPDALGDTEAVAAARQLREVLDGLSGSASRILVAWLDGVLEPEQ